MERSRKFTTVDNLKADFSNATTVFVVHYQGLSVLDISRLRKNLRECGAKITVTKNTLAKIAISGTEYGDLSNYFKGPIALLFSNDPVNLAKTLVDFNKVNDKLKIIAGSVDKEIIDDKEIDVLAKLPSLDELRGQLISIISNSASNLVSILNSSAVSIVRVIGEHSKEN